MTGDSSSRTPPLGQAVGRLKVRWKDVAEDPEWALMDFFSRFTFVRSIPQLLRRRTLTEEYDVTNSLFKPLDVERILAALNNDGYALGIDLPDGVLHDLVHYVRTSICYGESA